MKILLREYKNQQYVWVTAKYDGYKFIVDGRKQYETNIVSVINDNRKNYVKCSSCGKMFPKKGKKFAKHKEEARTIKPCLGCRSLITNEISDAKPRYIYNDDGTFTKKTETTVDLLCNSHFWTTPKCNSEDAINICKLRQCGTAKGEEIHDTFTDLPGIFDDIITVDKILDNGYEQINWSDNSMAEYAINNSIGLCAYVNRLGIVDKFYINTYEYGGYVWYSKKYDEFFTYSSSDTYTVWVPIGLNKEDELGIKAYIRKLYK